MADAHALTDKEIAKIQRHLAGIYAKAKKDVAKTVRAWAASIDGQASKLREAIDTAEDDQAKSAAITAYKQFFLKAVKEDKSLARASNTAVSRLYAANVEAAKYINGKTAAVYARHYNETGKKLHGALDGYSFKAISEKDAADFGDVTQQTVNKKKDTAWNKKNISTAIVAGAFMLWGAQKIADNAAASAAQKNRNGANRQASDMLTDAESKGSLDSMWRAYDEGFDEIKKEWVCVFDNRTRDTHIDYNDLGPVDLDYEYAPGLSRPRDDNCGDPAEVCNCRCALDFKTVFSQKGTRSAREGEVTGSYKNPSSFEGTESVTVQDMSFEEWMKWRSK